MRWCTWSSCFSPSLRSLRTGSFVRIRGKLFWRRSRHPARKNPFRSTRKFFPPALNSQKWACSINCGEKTRLQSVYLMYHIWSDYCGCRLLRAHVLLFGAKVRWRIDSEAEVWFWIVSVLSWCFEGFPSSNMSLWVDKYRPTSLSKLDYHKDLATHLKKLVRELFTNISYDLLHMMDGVILSLLRVTN